jgi:hypothetical protein
MTTIDYYSTIDYSFHFHVTVLMTLPHPHYSRYEMTLHTRIHTVGILLPRFQSTPVD